MKRRSNDMDRVVVALEAIASILFVIFLTNMAMCNSKAKADTIRIAIVDTGYNEKYIPSGQPKLKLCNHGHFDYKTGESKIGRATHLHGTMVAAIIAKELERVDYCAIIYNIRTSPGDLLSENVVSALTKASYEGVVAVNASYGGIIKSVAEREAMIDAGGRGALTFVAAGNEGSDLDKECLYFPTCFDVPTMYPVGALDNTGKHHKRSNHGSRVKLWFSGYYNGVYAGTSAATPRALSRFVQSLVAARRK